MRQFNRRDPSRDLKFDTIASDAFHPQISQMTQMKKGIFLRYLRNLWIVFPAGTTSDRLLILRLPTCNRTSVVSAPNNRGSIPSSPATLGRTMFR
ncbi:MAG: hypothetical protein JWN70_4844 [Planctomycetaceae bacterium]|nr:hypothetical protein [Planctomycetaceae bacterium]